MCKKCDQIKGFATQLETLLGDVPADAGAVVVSKLAQSLSRDGGALGQIGLENLLGLMWMQIASEILKHIETTPKTVDLAAMFLERYFGTRGDWNKQAETMERDFAERYPDKLGWLAEMSERVTRSVTQVIAELTPEARGLLN